MRGLTGPQRRQLKGIAHQLKPLVQVGKSGVTESLIWAVDRALSDHELIKVRFREYKESRKELSEILAERTGSEIVDIIGNVAILYRQAQTPRRGK